MLLEAETNKYCPGGYDIGAISNLITWVLNFFLSVEGPRVSSVLSFIGGIHIVARALHVLNLIWFVESLAYPSGEDGVNFLVQIIFTRAGKFRRTFLG